MILKRRLGLTDLKITEIGFGGAPIGNLYLAVSEEQAQEALGQAVASGIRYFDTAPLYGHGLSEQRLGRFWSTLEEPDFVVSSKVGRILRKRRIDEPCPQQWVDVPDLVPEFDYSRQGILRSFESSLSRLEMDTIPILLLHDIGAMTHGGNHRALLKKVLDQALPAMYELKKSGQVSAIGIGVNEQEVCIEILNHAEVDCILLAGRYTILEQSPLDKLFPLCADRRVSVIVGGPYNSGLMAHPSHPGAHYDYQRVPAPIYERARRIYQICHAHGIDPGAAALQFPLAHPVVSSVIPGLQTVGDVQSALTRYKAPLPEALWTDLKAAQLIRNDAPTQ